MRNRASSGQAIGKGDPRKSGLFSFLGQAKLELYPAGPEAQQGQARAVGLIETSGVAYHILTNEMQVIWGSHGRQLSTPL